MELLARILKASELILEEFAHSPSSNKMIALLLPDDFNFTLHCEWIETLLSFGSKPLSLSNEITVIRIPSRAPFPRLPIHPSFELEQQRLEARRAIANKLLPLPSKTQSTPAVKMNHTLVIASLQSYCELAPSLDYFIQNKLTLKTGESIPEKLTITLDELGYREVPRIQEPGDFRKNSYILDIFPIQSVQPVRIELFDLDIESIHELDLETQRREMDRTLPAITLHPTGRPASSSLSYESSELLARRISKLAAQSGLNATFSSGELRSLSHSILGEQSAYLPYLGALQLQPAYRSLQYEFQSRKFPVFSIAENKEGRSFPLECFRPLLQSNDSLSLLTHLLFADPLDETTTSLLTEDDKQYWTPQVETLPNGAPSLQLPGLSGDVRGIFFQDQWIRTFHRSQKRSISAPTNDRSQTLITPKPSPESPSDDSAFSSLFEWPIDNGDIIAHRDYGIGRSLGLVTVTQKEKGPQDFLKIEFADCTLYVPPYQFSKLSFLEAENSEIRLSSIKNEEHQKKLAVYENLIGRTIESLLLAEKERAKSQARALVFDTSTMDEFISSFSYVDTPDQVKVTQEILTDLRQQTPMNRLLFGDVGYGKTEISIRACYAAALSGTQSLLLAPTTILATQHTRTFQDRFTAYGVRVAMATGAEKGRKLTELIEDFNSKKIDVLIGTQKILNHSFNCNNVSLLVVDEEHRFGVKDKDIIKTRLPEVHILQMTATPIPRTFFSSLSGLRSISTLLTAPRNRQKIQTQVGQWSIEVIEEAIDIELTRGGKVFIVVNSIFRVEELKRRLTQRYPGIQIGTLHSKLKSKEIRDTEESFALGSLQILCATSIVESGIDVPNANTLILLNPHRFGFAQLYQLRGRIGRGGERAYAYFLLDENTPRSNEALTRVLQFTKTAELEGMMQLALLDLELRGAGDLFGLEQTGFREDINPRLFYQLLEERLRSIRDKRTQTALFPLVKTEYATHISEAYIHSSRERYRTYRTVSLARSKAELLALIAQIRDEFGPIPPSLQLAISLQEIAIDLQKWPIREAHFEKGQIRLVLDEHSPLIPDNFLVRLSRQRSLQILPPRSLQFPVSEDSVIPTEDNSLGLPREFLKAKSSLHSWCQLLFST